MFDKAKGIITKKIGPLPLWAYVVLGGVMVFVLSRGRGGAKSSDQQFVAANPAQNTIGGSDTVSTPPSGTLSTSPPPAVPADNAPLLSAIAALASQIGQQNSLLNSMRSSQRNATPGATPTTGGAPTTALPMSLIPGVRETDQGFVFPQGDAEAAVAKGNQLRGFVDPATGELSDKRTPGAIPVFA